MDGCSAPIGLGLFMGCAMVFILLLVGIGLAGTKLGWGGGSGTFSGTISTTLSTQIPPNFARLFSEAEEKSGVPAPMIAAIYLTEHHTDTFGRDLTSPDQVLSPCKENKSGAAGPMQFLKTSWPASKLKAAGITSPDRCKYRDSIIGAGFLLDGKADYPSVKAVCKKDSAGKWQMTDSCISIWGQSYCGVGGCNNMNCGAPKYLYCEEVVRKYKLVVSG
jgi:hypothetical protein